MDIHFYFYASQNFLSNFRAEMIARYVKNINLSLLMLYWYSLFWIWWYSLCQPEFIAVFHQHIILQPEYHGDLIDSIIPEYWDGEIAEEVQSLPTLVQFGDKCPLYGWRESQAKAFFESAIVYFSRAQNQCAISPFQNCYIKMSWHMCLKCKIYKKEKNPL